MAFSPLYNSRQENELTQIRGFKNRMNFALTLVLVAVFFQSRSIDASQCSDAVCKALYADLLPSIIMQKDELTVEQPLAIEELVSCYSGNVDCDKREELENDVYHVLQELYFVQGEPPKLAPYFFLCHQSFPK